MKRLLLILILTLSIQTLVKADDISDFQIEGMSVGDSALDYFVKDQLMNLEKGVYPNSDNFYFVVSPNKNFLTYDEVIFHFKKNDDNYVIHAIGGALDFVRASECFKKQKEIKNDIIKMLPMIKENSYEFRYSEDDTGKSFAVVTDFKLNIGDIRVWCTDWSKKMEDEKNRGDNAQITIQSKELSLFMLNDAYK